MFLQTRPIKLYAVKFITDLAIRSDDNPVEFTCPFRGMNDIVMKYNNKETVAGLEMLFEKQADFDADKIRPVLDEEYIGEASVEEFKEMLHEDASTIQYSPAIHKLDFPHYYRRIEDIHENYLASYLGNVVFNVRNKSGGLKDFEREHKDAYSYVSVGDNGEEVTESADLLAGPQISLSEVASVQEALLKLPFVVKRLWSFSKLTKIHVLSYIQSYLLAKEANEKALQFGTTTAYLKSNDVIRVGVYSCNTAGEITKLVDVNHKNKHAAAMFDWIVGYSPDYRSFYKNFRDFKLYCEVLNIDILHDNMLEYDKEFIDKLRITTVTSNELYDTMVAEAIMNNSGNPVQTPNQEIMLSGEESIYNTIRSFNDFILSSVNEQRKVANMSGKEHQNIENAAKYLYFYYRNKYYNETVDFSKISWREGFMYYADEVVRIPLEIIHRGLADDGSLYNYGLISEIGSFIKLTPDFMVKRTMLLDVVNYVKNKDSFIEVSVPKWEQLSL